MNDAANADYDVIVVGAGHNGLICAAYLAKAGYRIGVFERRPSVGGAVVTEEVIPGFRFDLGGSAHSFIHLTPIIDDLQLAAYGLDYIDLDPMFFMPFPDGTHLMLWRSIEQTCDSIARFSAHDAQQYRRLCREWTPVALAVRDMMLTSPAPLALGQALLSGLVKRRGWNALHLPQLRYSVIQFLNHYFEREPIKALLGWLAAQSGLPPDAPGTAFIVMWNLLYHQCGVRYPRGGSGALTQALARFITERNGTALTNSPVKHIVVHKNRAVGVALADGTVVRGKIIVAATHILTTARLLNGHLPRSVQRRIRNVKPANGLGLALRLATTALPDYLAYPSNDGLAHTAIQLICPSLSYLRNAWQAYANGQLADNPLVSIMTFSAQDKSLSPPGKHVISLWAQYFPYQLSNHMRWDQVEQTAADRIVATVAQYAPNIRDSIIDQLIESPLYLERELGLVRGDLQHLQLSPGQMFMLRPAAGLSQYRAPIDGLYLTGASTHPGGGIMGMSGYNAAHVILNRETL